MSEYQYFEAIYLNMEYLRAAAMDFTTVFFAYAVSAHLVGRSLGRRTAILTSTIYSLFLLAPFTAIIMTGRGHTGLMERATTTYPDSVAFFIPHNALVMIPITFLPATIAWIVSLAYMHGVVRKDLDRTQQ